MFCFLPMAVAVDISNAYQLKEVIHSSLVVSLRMRIN